MEAGQSEKGARRFEELWVWQQARELVKEIYEDLRAGSGSKDFGFRTFSLALVLFYSCTLRFFDASTLLLLHFVTSNS
jgi:hypothetical protein